MDFFFYVLAWGTLAVLVGELAKRRHRDARNWVALAFLISPPLAFLILMMIERASQTHSTL
jgi:hypothetical protein